MSAATAAFAYLDSRTERSGDEVSVERFQLIADKIEADPSLLCIPLENIERWLSQGHRSVTRLEGWRNKLTDAQQSKEGMARLLTLLRDEAWESQLWKGFSPFPGILSSEELQRLSWKSRH
jgi:hypothetical protein